MGLDQQEFQQEKMKNNSVERYSNHLMLKEIGGYGQKLLKESKVLIVGLGGLGCPVLQYAAGSGIGTIGLIDNDDIEISNLHRQTIFSINDIGKPKVEIAEKFSNFINPETKTIIYKDTLNKKNAKKLIEQYDYIVDGSDNFKTKFLINDYCLKLKKFLVVGAISKFDGHIFSYNFNNKNVPCLRCFFQEDRISDDILNCEYEGILGTVAGIIGTLQANEVLKKILNIKINKSGIKFLYLRIELNHLCPHYYV